MIPIESKYRILNADNGTSGSSQNEKKRDYKLSIHTSLQNVPLEAKSQIQQGGKMPTSFREYSDANLVHTANSKHEILYTASIAIARNTDIQVRKALVPGAGYCSDIPLKRLAELFDEVVLIDLNVAATEYALKKLPISLQKKIHLVGADITGFAGEYCQSLKALAQRSLSREIFFEKAAEFTDQTVNQLNALTPNFGGDYTFISSQLVMSQLRNISDIYLKKIVEAEYGHDIPYSPPYPFFRASENLLLQLQREHIAFLSRSVLPQGTIHVADTYEKTMYSPSFQRPRVVQTPYKDIRAYIDTYFQLLKDEEQWMWEDTFSKEGYRQDFSVFSLSLGKKP